MTRTDAIARAHQYLHSGEFLRELDRRVAYPTESQNPGREGELRAYLDKELQPAFSQLGFSTRLIESPTGKNPYLLADYRENASAPTAWSANGGTTSIHGTRRPSATGSTAAAPPTTRGSTASICRRFAPCARRAAEGLASMPNSSSKWARRSGRRICVR